MPTSWFLLVFLFHAPTDNQIWPDSWIAANSVEYQNPAACNDAAQDQAAANNMLAAVRGRQRNNPLTGVKMVTMCVQGFSFTDAGP